MDLNLAICPDCDKEFTFDDDNVKAMDTGNLDRYYSCIYLSMVTCPHCDSDLGVDDLDPTWIVTSGSKYLKSTSSYEQSGMLSSLM